MLFFVVRFIDPILFNGPIMLLSRQVHISVSDYMTLYKPRKGSKCLTTRAHTHTPNNLATKINDEFDVVFRYPTKRRRGIERNIVSR